MKRPAVNMSARINQVKYKPTGINQNAISIRRNSGNRVSGNRWLGRSCGFRLVKRSIMSPAVFLKHLGGKVAKALRLERRPSPGVSSSGRSRPSVAPIDAHRAEAIEDCIEFINSASLSRSNSIVTIRSGNQYYGREAKKFDMVRVFMHFPGSTVDHVRVIDQNMQLVAVITVHLHISYGREEL
ncbi:hypothetical protein POTOM_005485 [Populus tomentosa]|uniref:Uncharacterized protein n=1 Tax=Populus tomentosa TaxID=118781 RepID=A0A8X8AH49_POPTO|nr:hypothetical protein POTOM_005485 [Populus tomentosa]